MSQSPHQKKESFVARHASKHTTFAPFSEPTDRAFASMQSMSAEEYLQLTQDDEVTG